MQVSRIVGPAPSHAAPTEPGLGQRATKRPIARALRAAAGIVGCLATSGSRALVVGLTAAALVAPAFAQKRAVYPDESVVAGDALTRVKELAAAGNMPEALRVLQETMEAEGDRLLADTADTDLFVPVRQVIHRMLLADAGLLAKFREIEGPRAQAELDKGNAAGVERSRLLTPGGLDAALRVAEGEFRAARFESARLILGGLEQHPDRRTGSDAGKRCAEAAARLTAYLPREDVRGWAERWAREAGVRIERPAPVPPPAAAGVRGLTPESASPAPAWHELPESPLQTLSLDEEAFALAAEERRGLPGETPIAAENWIFPTVSGDTVYVNDGARVSAWDSATLAPIWAYTPAGGPDGRKAAADDSFSPFMTGNSRTLDDVAGVTVRGGVVAAATGVPLNGSRKGDTRVHVLDAATGTPLWAVDLPWLDRTTLDGASVRGPLLIEGDRLILAARKASPARRVNSVSLVGLDLYTGDLCWQRPLGSVGTQPWARAQSRADGAVLHRGVVYRGDEIGVLGAFEAATGRPLWVRTAPMPRIFDPQQWRQAESGPPYELCTPVVMEGAPERGDSLFALEPGRARIIQVDARDGRLIAARDAGALAEPRYLLGLGSSLVGVGQARVALVGVSDWAQAAPKLSPVFAKPGIVGRVIAAGDRLLVPLENGIGTLDPAHPQDVAVAEISGVGNPLIAGDAKAGVNHLLIAGGGSLHTYLGWDEARSLLDGRVAAHPNDPAPLLTYVELLYRAGSGRAAGVPEMADRALRVLDARRAEPDSLAARSRLFALLLDMVRTARENWSATPPPGPTASNGGRAKPATDEGEGRVRVGPTLITDASLLDAIVQRMARCAEGPREQVDMLLERGWLRERLGDARGAAEAYQEILLDAALAQVEVPQGEDDVPSGVPEHRAPGAVGAGGGGGGVGGVGGVGPLLPPRPSVACAEATARLRALLRTSGAQPYDAFEEQASGELAACDGRVEALLAVAARFPCSSSAPDALERAAEAMAGSGKRADARAALGRAFAAAEFGVTIGRDAQRRALPRLAGKLVNAMALNEAEPARRLLRRLRAADPTPGAPGAAPASADGLDPLLATLDRRVLERSGPARIGAEIARRAQALEGWMPLDTIVRGGRGDSGDAIVLSAPAIRQVALWARSPEDARLRPLWTRQADAPPGVIRVGIDASVLYWPTAGGGQVEAVDHLGGKSLWRTADFSSLFKGDSYLDRVATPLDGQVRSDDLLVAMDDATLVLVQRRGRAAAINLADGKVLWARALDVSRVYDVERVGSVFVVSGQSRADAKPDQRPEGRGDPKAVAVVVGIDLRTGEQRSSLDSKLLGDHVRTVLAVHPSGGGGAGGGSGGGAGGGAGGERLNDAVVVTSDNVLRFNALTGKVEWANDRSPAVGSVSWRVVGDALFVVDSKLDIFRLNLTDGSASPALEKRHGLQFPLRMTAVDAGLAVSTTQGVAVYAPDGRLIGADSLDAANRVEPAAIGHKFFVALDQDLEMDPGGQTAMSTSRLYLIDNPSGRLRRVERLVAHDVPERVLLLDGKIMVEAGDVTLVLDAP